MEQRLRILHLEDDPADADLIAATLAADGLVCDYVRAASRAQFMAVLDGAYDLILSDFALPGFDGASAQTIARDRRPDLPFVFVSGTIGEEAAIDRLKDGATDYVLKQRLARLPSAVRRALKDARDRRERRHAEGEVRRLNEQLEQRVNARTAELARANAVLATREVELADAKSFLEQLLAASPSMIFRFQPDDLRITYVSPNIGWLLGYSREDVVGVTGFWEKIIHPDDRDRVIERLREAMDSVVAQIEQEYRCRSQDGRYRWFFNLLRIEYDLDARPTAVLGYALDIADRKAAEEEVRQANAFLDSIVENLPHMVFVKDARDLRFVRLNRAGEQMLGVKRGEVIGHTDYDFVPPALADKFTAQDRETLHGRILLDIPEEVLATRDRSPRILHTKKIPIVDSQGLPQYLLGISEDITERRANEESARLSRLEAERANRAKSEFLSRMSHDLRTPLNAILGFAQILELDAHTPEEADSVRQILNGGQHLLDLINEVLDIASIEAGRLSLSPEPVSVEEIVRQVLDLLRPLADARGISLGYQIEGGDLAYVRADRQRLKQILLNLAGNAVKYNRQQGSVRITSVAGPDGRVRARVTDSGPGISAEKMKLLFQPFERLGADRTGVEGTGLGLAVSKGLAGAMGGSLGVESTEGVGTTFWIDIPATPGPAQRVHEAVGLPRLGDQAHGTAGTILYIEDNASNIRLLERLLSRRPGVCIVSVTTGEEGLETAHRINPDLILLDMHLPDMGGEEVLARLRAEAATSAIPVAVLSADAVSSQRERLLASGAVAYLTKPLDIASAFRLIDERLAARPRMS
jgi:PAS domain S-box-containing protein